MNKMNKLLCLWVYEPALFLLASDFLFDVYVSQYMEIQY